MFTLSSTTELVSSLRHAHDVEVVAYLLPPGDVLDALAAAARSGAHVRVRLDGAVYKDPGSLAKTNAEAVRRLRAAGADASVERRFAPHAKAVLIDDAVAYLDDRNWPPNGGDTIVRDDSEVDVRILRDALAGRPDTPSRCFASEKSAALASEARLVRTARRGDNVVVETESFGEGNAVFAALETVAKRGAHVHVLVNARDLAHNARERAALARLRHDGASIRATNGQEKFAIVNGARAWIGSANATASYRGADSFDWGARTHDRATLTHLRAAFRERWNGAMREA